MSRRAPGKPFSSRSAIRVEVAILLIVAVVRGLHFVGNLENPLFAFPASDPDPGYHDAWAGRIASGALSLDGAFFRAPLYPYFLGFLYWISGSSLTFARGVQLALGLVSVWLLFRIGAGTLGRRAGWIAGLAYGIYPVALRIEGELLLEGLFILLLLGSMLSYLKSLSSPGIRNWLVTGCLFGLAAVTRPNVLLFIVMVPLVTFWFRRMSGTAAPAGTLARQTGLFALGVALPILPVTVHNAVKGGEFVPIATQGGINFYIGNNPEADGMSAVFPGSSISWTMEDVRKEAEAAEGRSLTPSGVSRYYTAQGLDFLVSEPGRALGLYLRKIYLFWWGAEISNNTHEYFVRRYSLPLRLTLWHAGVYFPFGLVGPLALVGMVLAWFRLRSRALPLAAFVLAYMVSVVLFFVCARFRLPVIPFLLLFAAYAGLALPELLRAKRRVPAGAALVGLVVLLNADPFGLRPAVFGSQALSYLDLGVWHAGRGENDLAESMMREAARHDPGNPTSYAWLGRLAIQRGDPAEGEAQLRTAVRGDPFRFPGAVSQAYTDLGRLEAQRGRFTRALELFGRALQINERDVDAHVGAGFSHLALEDTAAARLEFESALVLSPGHSQIQDIIELLDRSAPDRPR